ncbi:MAG: hypothetical protein QOE86_4578 [Solirubrobacteraceae bacterium]|nr:hypothetical protein [Solirubrobacteraceae bacterium]
MVTPGVFAGGIVLLAVALGCAAYAGWVAWQRVVPGATGLDGFVAWAVLATAALIAEHLVPLALGLLSRPAVVAASLAVAALARWQRPRTPRPAPLPPATDEPGSRAVRVVAAIAVALAGGAALAYLRQQAGQPIVSSDALNFQLPQVARWIDSGSMWQLDQFFPDYSNATYPQHGNVLLLAVVLPFHSAFLARLVPAAYGVAACLAVAAGARELGTPRAWAALAAALFAAIPVLAKVAIDGANTDTPMTFAFMAGALFLLRHRRTHARGDLVLAGVALGIALGTKWYALTTLPPLVAVWALARLAARTPWRRVAAETAAVTAVAVLVGGIWLVRNTVEASNPLFPQPLGPFPAPPDPIRAAAGWNLAHYLFDGEVWRRYLLPQFDAFFAAPGYVLFAGGLAAIAAAAWRRALVPAAAGLAALALVAGYGVVTYGAFGPEGAPVLAFASTRYALPALAVGACGLAWAASRLPSPAQVVIASALGVAVLQGLRAEYRPGLPLWQIAAAASIVAAAVAVSRRVPPRVLAGAALVLAVAGAGITANRLDGRSYAAADPVLGWIDARAPSGHRVGLAGIWGVSGVSPVLPAFGPRLGNRVEYAGPFVAHMLRRYDDPARFTARLRARRYDLLVVGRGHGVAPEEAWARAAGYAPVVSSPGLALLRRRAPG